ncbi:MAG: aminoacetone oxidase family FAD-binding enzyme [Bacteroidales bacterium]|nr:aminoacetone oxidase family FAD-binding enzyme [Bacteroidales bacterium]
MDTNNNRVIVIGGGASGLFISNILLEKGFSVLLIEKKHQAGLKLRITGKGRCNLTNTCLREEYLKHISSPRFFEFAFDTFDNKALCSFFKNRGLGLVEERGGRVFPESGKSLDVFLNLLNPLEENPKAEIIKNCQAEHIIVRNKTAIGVSTSEGDFYARHIVLATGGMTYPSTGATGDGYYMAEELGHTVVRPLPVLVGLRTKDGYPGELQDFLVKNCEVSVINKSGLIKAKLFGDIYLDKYGVSGPVILTLSRVIAEDLDRGETLFLKIDFKPRLSEEKLLAEIRSVFAQRRTEEVSSVLRKWFAKQMLKDVLVKCGLNPKMMAKNLKEEDFKSILWYLKQRKQRIIGDMGWKEAIITKGGISLDEVDSRTMKSKKIKNLSFCGEVLDLDADTGGYNLQIAFSTAFLAAAGL